MDDVEIRATDPASVEAQWAMSQYFSELDEHFPGGFDVQGPLEDAVSRFRGPRSRFLIAFCEGVPVGCGALKVLDDTRAELRRMWVSPTCRRHGVATRLLKRLEEEAAGLGCRRVVLDTHGSLHGAIALYRRGGFKEIEDYNGNPDAQHWFEKDLTPPSG